MENLKKLKMTTSENYKILGKYIKDMSSETPDIETYLFVKDFISKYHLNIDTPQMLRRCIALLLWFVASVHRFPRSLGKAFLLVANADLSDCHSFPWGYFGFHLEPW